MTMTSPEIRALIAERLQRCGSNPPLHPESLAHHEGIFRGLIWALTGKDPDRNLLRDPGRLLDLAGIAHREESNRIVFAMYDGEPSEFTMNKLCEELRSPLRHQWHQQCGIYGDGAPMWRR